MVLIESAPFYSVVELFLDQVTYLHATNCNLNYEGNRAPIQDNDCVFSLAFFAVLANAYVTETSEIEKNPPKYGITRTDLTCLRM